MGVSINTNKRQSFKDNVFVFLGADLSRFEAQAAIEHSVVMLKSEFTGNKVAFNLINSGEFLKEDLSEGYEYVYQGMGENSHLKMLIRW